MTKQQVIDILENFRPPRDKYCPSPVDDYVDDMIDSRIDNIIEFVKREPDDWIKCSEKMPEPMRQVLFYDERFKECATGYYNKNYNAIQVGCALLGTNDEYERFTHWMPLPEPPEVEQ